MIVPQELYTVVLRQDFSLRLGAYSFSLHNLGKIPLKENMTVYRDGYKTKIEIDTLIQM